MGLFKKLKKKLSKTIKKVSKVAGKVLKVATPVAIGVLAATGVGTPLALAAAGAAGSLGSSVLSGGSVKNKFKALKKTALTTAAAGVGGGLIGAYGGTILGGIGSAAKSAGGAIGSVFGGGGAQNQGDGQYVDIDGNPISKAEYDAAYGKSTDPGVGVGTPPIVSEGGFNVGNALGSILGDVFPGAGFPKNSGAGGSTGSEDPRGQGQETAPQIGTDQDQIGATYEEEQAAAEKKAGQIFGMPPLVVIGGAALLLLLVMKSRKAA